MDIVLLSLVDETLETVLVRRGSEPFRGCWAFPGGFVDIGETLADAAARELSEETGIRDVCLEAFGTFDAVDRDPRGRTISVAHIGLTGTRVTPQPADDAVEAMLVSLEHLPELAFDHAEMIESALEWLAARLGLCTRVPASFTHLTTAQQSATNTALTHLMERRRQQPC